MVSKKEVKLNEYIDAETEYRMRSLVNNQEANNEKNKKEEAEISKKESTVENISLQEEIKPRLNTIILDDGKGGTFQEAKERMYRVYELKTNRWYKKLKDLFAQHQEKHLGEEFLIPEDCPEEIGRLFIEDMLAAAKEQGLEASADIIKKEENVAIPEHSLKEEKQIQKETEPKNLEYPHGLIASYLGNLYIQGMEPYQMRRLLLPRSDEKIKDKLDNLASSYTDFAAIRNKINDKKWVAEVKFFLKQLERGRDKEWGFDPAQRLLAEVIIEQPKITEGKLAQLNTDNESEINERFIQTARRVWDNFVYSGEWEYRKEGGYQLKDKAGFDAKVSLFLLEKAGLVGAKTASATEPGKIKSGFTNIDTQPIAGARLKYVEGKPTLAIGNNPKGRTLAETSSAKIIWRLLTAADLLDKKDEALHILTEMTVDDDNGHLITNKQQFKNSPYTLRGLAKGFSLPDIYSYITEQWQRFEGDKVAKITNWPKRQQAWQEIYRKILDSKLDKYEVKKYNLNKHQSQLIKRGIFTEKILAKSKEKLEQEGRVIDTKYGLYLVSINKWWPKGQQYLAGHEGVRAYGYDGIVIYDPFNNSFKVNSVKPEVDLSRDWKLPQGRADKGIMVISYGEPLRVSLKDILTELEATEAVDNPQGYLKEFLDLEGEVKNYLAEKNSAIIDHCRKLYQSWPQEAQSTNKEEREREIYNLYQETLSEVRKEIYNKYIESRQTVSK